MRVETKYVDFDYSEYLGDGYKETQQLPPKASTVVANHQCWLDSLILICTPLFPGFAAKVETKKVWVLASLIDALQSLYISRGGTDEERQQIIKDIIARQELVEADPRYPPICVYPEGT